MSKLLIQNNSQSRRKLEFDKKLKQIENDELKLKRLEEELNSLQARMARETNPIVEEFCELRFQNLTRLKEFLNGSSFKKKEKRLIIHLMTKLASGLMDAGDPRAQDFIESEMNEVDDGDHDNDHQTHTFTPSPPTKEAMEGKHEIKSLFRQLAKAFHPDKEPLEHLKEEKTTLMKKIMAAYENQDLYGLLKIEKEHLGPREFTEDKIELYIKHINDRLKELKTLEARLKKHGPLAMIYKFIYSRKATLQEHNIRHELSKIEAEVEKEKELQAVLWDQTLLRNFLKN
jgi:hypothetical protein